MSQITGVASTGTAVQSGAQSMQDQLGVDEFLNILVSQLQNQDPLDPMDNSEMIAQLAQFSMLDGINSLQGSISDMKSIEMIGKEITAVDPESGETIQGIVQGVSKQDGKILLNINGNYVAIDNVVEVTAAPDTAVEGSADYTGLSAEGQEIAAGIVNFAKQFMDYPYVLGAESPEDGFDCSGFTQYVYGNAGYELRRSAEAQGYSEQYAKIESIDNLEIGDLVFFNTVEDSDLSDHVGIYMGDHQFIHASTVTDSVRVSSLDESFYNTAFSWGMRIIE